MRSLGGFLLSVLSLLSLPIATWAQSGNATVSGSVTDATGAVIPNAKVSATNTATDVTRTVETTAAGFYDVPTLIPGPYKITVGAPGFRSKEITGIQLVIDQQARIDVRLEVASSTQSVTVTGESAPLLQASEASVGYVVQSRQVTDLPLNGRYFSQLLVLSPGATLIGFQRNQMPMFNVNGQDNTSIFFRLDGIENNEREFGGANIPISIDAIQEVKVQTSSFSAEYGRSPVQIDATVKSGTNQIHGTLFEFLRNNDLDAPVWSFTGPHTVNLLKRNQFGGTVGGPIKKDRVFYFFSYDGTRERFSQPQVMTVPSNDMRNGIFPAGVVIFDPMTQQPFPNNTIPESRWDPIAKKVLAYLPPPNTPGVSNTNAAGFDLAPSENFFYNPFRNQTINQYTGRVDYNQSQKNTFFGRYTYSSNLRVGQGPLATNVQSSLNGVENANIGGMNLSGAWNRNISPYTLNELRGGFSTDPQDYEKADNTDYASQLGLKPFLQPDAYPGFPSFIIGNVKLGSGDYRPLKVGEKNFQLTDTMTLIRGSHSLRVGGDFRRTVLETTNNQLSTGRFNFNGAQTRDRSNPNTGTTFCPGSTTSRSCTSGDAFADFLLGDLSRATDGTPIPDIHKYFSNWAGFVNDTWNVRRNLTLTIGLRYEYQTRFHSDPLFYTQPVIRNGDFAGMVALANDSKGNLPSGISPVALAQAPGAVVTCRSIGLPDNCLVSQKNGWQPRLGFAYRLGQKTVIRSGAGIFIGSYYGDADTESCQSWPLVLTPDTPTFTVPPTGTAPPPLSLSNPFAGANPAKPSFANCAKPNRKLPTSYQWNLAVERTLDANTTLTVSYVGIGGRHLDEGNGQATTQEQYNVPQPWGVVLAPNQVQTRPYPAFGSVAQYENIGSSSYNALQIKAEHRLSHGLFFSVAYTWAKNILVQPWLSDPRNFNLDRGPANNDVRHVLTLSPIYTLPFGRGQRFANHNRTLDVLIGGWQVSGILNYRTGLPFTPTISGFDELLLGGLNPQNRPDRKCDGSLSHPTVFQWFDVSCFTLPGEPTTPGATLHEGTSGLNILRGPHWFSFDAGVDKSFHLSERINLDFRTEAFNAFNHPILDLPNRMLSRVATATSQTRIIGTAPNTFPRIIQLAMKLRF